MKKEDKAKLEALSLEQYHKARFALEAIDVRARDFTINLDNEQELRQIIIRAFAVMQQMLRSRQDNNTPLPEEHELLSIKEDLVREQRMTSNNAESYKAVYLFIEAAEKIASIPLKEITSDYKSLGNLAMSQVGMPIQRI